MEVAEVYIEYSTMALNHGFTYDCGAFNVRRGERVLVEFAHKQVVGFVDNVKNIDDSEITKFDYEIKPIINLIDEKPLLNEESFAIAKYMSHICVAPLISCFQAMLPNKLKPKSNEKPIKKVTYVRYLKDADLKGTKQQEAMEYIKVRKEVERSIFNKRFSCLGKLLERQTVELVEREATADISQKVQLVADLVLNDQQQKAFDSINNSTGFNVSLIHGVTGSGKTEVYLHLARKTLEKGRQVLILVPEIGLTPQMVTRVKSRFGNSVAIYHSSLNNQEKYEQFKLVQENKVNIVVGTRSSIFMPFKDLGLIIMDEEHDQSYKQDSTPRYHCRDIALFRAEYHKCNIVLASATPSLESYARAYKGVYKLIELPDRIFGNMPDTELIDMQQQMRKHGNYVVSRELLDKITDRIKKGEQVIILLNRRGYSPILRCIDCGEVVKCPHCDLALNYHKSINRLVCHTCGYNEPVIHACKKCGSTNIKYLGIGTQKLEEYLHKSIPGVRILRMDADSTQRKNAHEKMLNAFETRKYDILLGTQMIAKGLDFENVTLVGILNGDALLNRTDYRSVEMTFDLLTQASGRSGRGANKGEVVIQAYDTSHYAITCAARHDYKSFFAKEMQFRHLGKYPPYTYLAAIIMINHDSDRLKCDIDKLIHACDFEGIRILGPVELLMRNDEQRSRIILKSPDFEKLLKVVNELSKKQLEMKLKSRLDIDINPIMME